MTVKPNQAGMATPTQSLAQAKTVRTEAAQAAQTWLLAGLRGWGLIVLTLHLAAYQLPEETFWSLWPYTFLSPWLGWGLALLAGSLILAPANRAILAWLERLWSAWPARSARQRWFGLIALAAGLLFWLARLRHLRWLLKRLTSLLPRAGTPWPGNLRVPWARSRRVQVCSLGDGGMRICFSTSGSAHMAT